MTENSQDINEQGSGIRIRRRNRVEEFFWPKLRGYETRSTIWKTYSLRTGRLLILGSMFLCLLIAFSASELVMLLICTLSLIQLAGTIFAAHADHKSMEFQKEEEAIIYKLRSNRFDNVNSAKSAR